MNHRFAVDHLDVERLLADWRWLCPQSVILAARNVYADLFLRDEAGEVFHLNVGIGTLTKVASSQAEFLALAETQAKREEWFAESEEQAAATRGLKPNADQCIGFSVPIVFAESRRPDTPYVADIYDHVSFLGDLHRHISSLPDGTKVHLKLKS